MTALRQYVDERCLHEGISWTRYVRKRCRSLRAGQRAAVIMSLIQNAKLIGHEPYRYLKDVLERLPTQPASRIENLLPHHWKPTPTHTAPLNA